MIQNCSKWSTTVQNYAQLWSQRGQKWSWMVKNSQNSIINLLKGRIIGATHGKKGIWPQKHDLSKIFGVKWLFFHLQRPFLFFRRCEKSCKEAIERKKSGCHPWKNGHLTPKTVKLGQIDSWWAIVPISEVKKTKVSPQYVVRWFKTAPNGPQRCKIMLNFGPKDVKNGPGWLKIVKIQ